MIKISIQEQEDNMVAVIDGRLDTPASPKAGKALEPLLHCHDKDVVLDCTRLDYISSSGLRIFLDILKNVKAHGHQVYLKNISDSIREAFVLTGFINLFKYI